MLHKKSLSVMMQKFFILVLLAGLFIYIKPFYSVSSVQQNDQLAVKVISTAELEDLIKNRNGKPLFINVWATWCAPCREEFPDLVKIANVYSGKIEIIGISVDFPEEIDSQIIPFLKKQNAEFANYVIKVTDPEDFINLLDKDWFGAIPATFIFDEKGNQKEFLLGKQSYNSFEKAVREVLD